ncbi:MAG: type II secretion system F family protein [Verrucomicrobiota bacterium]
MNYDEFAFFNQQLAGMLRTGIPLEGALHRLCSDMRAGSMRSELEKLEQDLARGVPLEQALQSRKLPDLYRRLVLLGARGNDVPGALTLLADYYQRRHLLWTRMKGLMVYPLIVLFTSFVVSLVFYIAWNRIYLSSWQVAFAGLLDGRPLPAITTAALPLLHHLWVFPTLLGLLFLAFAAALVLPGFRNGLRWRLPAFREASIAQTSGTLSLLLKGGVPLPESLSLAADLESQPKARQELRSWAERIAGGVTRFSDAAAGSRMFPPLFVWLVSSAGEDPADGFQQAARVYQERAAHRSEILLFAALPMMVLALGFIIVTQGWLLMSGFIVFIDLLNNLGC